MVSPQNDRALKQENTTPQTLVLFTVILGAAIVIALFLCFYQRRQEGKNVVHKQNSVQQVIFDGVNHIK